MVGRSLCRYDQNTWFFVAAVLVPPSRSRNLGRTFMYMFFVTAVYYTALPVAKPWADIYVHVFRSGGVLHRLQNNILEFVH